MKKCPQCNSVYADDTQHCPADGRLLISEVLPLPSQVGADEEITIIRHEPVVIDLSEVHAANSENRPSQIPARMESVAVNSGQNFKNYLVFLITGVLLGGGLVLATLFLARNFYQNNETGSAKSSPPAPVDSNQNQNNNESKNTDSPANKPMTASARHLEKTAAGDEEFNGRVITLNAYVRSSPSRNAAELDVLPVDDRLKITAREDADSPWFHVVCEHGSSGWMHGNTIEYTR